MFINLDTAVLKTKSRHAMPHDFQGSTAPALLIISVLESILLLLLLASNSSSDPFPISADILE